jgi:crossover junction endodeoxyribonuclease RuvC
MRILGIDPGSTATGYGVVERSGSCIVYIAHGTLRARASAPLEQRLAGLQRGLEEAIREHRPERAVVERVFVSVNANSALVLGQARGAILAALGATGVPVDELTARQIKKAVTGAGAADKRQVQAMVTQLLGLAKSPAQDAADALAAAICRAQMGRLLALGVSTGAGRAARRRRSFALPGASS